MRRRRSQPSSGIATIDPSLIANRGGFDENGANMDVMGTPTGRALAGRAAELDVMDALFRRSIDDQECVAALVSGEAGVGKTRFVHEAGARAAARGAHVVIGRCVEHADALGPLRDIVVSINEQLGTESFEIVLGAARAALGPLAGLPEADSAASSPRDLTNVALGMFQRLLARGPVLAVFEDLQWADPVSGSLFRSLAAAEWHESLTVVGTYRSGPLERRDRLVSLVADVSRSARPTQIWLDRLDETDASTLVRDIDPSIDDAEAREIVTRSDGLPFFIEELVAARRSGVVGLPDSVRSVVLARTADLDDRHHDVLGVLALAGRLDVGLISAVTGLRDDVAEAAIVALTRSGAVIFDRDVLQFRHELVREVFDDDLPPWRRVSIHAGLATAVERQHPERHSVIARHRLAANQLAEALVESYAAGASAIHAGVPVEALDHYETVLQLWDAVPDPTGLVGVDLDEVLLAASDAARRGHRLDRAIQHADRALAIATESETNGQAIARILLRLRDLHRYAGRPDDGARSVREALDVLDAGGPTVELALALSFASIATHEDGNAATARQLAQRAADVAEELDDAEAQVYAYDALAAAIISTDRTSAREFAQRAVDCCEPATPIEARLLAAVGVCNLAGHEAHWDDMFRHAREARAAAARVGFSGPREQLLLGYEVYALVMLGRWADAEQVAADSATGISPRSFAEWALLIARARQGRCDDARPAADRRRTLARSPIGHLRNPAVIALAEFDVNDGRVGDAVALVDGALPSNSRDGIAMLTALAIAVLVEHSSGSRSSGASLHDNGSIELAERWLTSMGEVIDDEPGTSEAVHARQAAAELDRLRGKPSAADWAALAAAWHELQMPYEEARARLVAAEAHLFGVAGRSAAARDDAARELISARSIATWLGARPLLVRIDSLAASSGLLARFDEPGSGAGAEPELDRYHLTRREREVLALVAAGRTNGEIATELFINTKTVSVHISNILRKLGVSNRVEAATRALHEGLVPTSPRVEADGASGR